MSDIKEKKIYEPGHYLKLTTKEKDALFKKFKPKTLADLKEKMIKKCLE